MKSCFSCLARLPASGFYKHPAMRDGRLNKCKSCVRADMHRRRNANLAVYRERDRKRAVLPHRVALREKLSKTEKYKSWKREYQRECRKQQRLKFLARQKLGYAVKAGKIVRSGCVECGSLDSDGHHDDYSKPLKVIWLCPEHHKQRHVKLGWGYGSKRKD